MKLTTLLGPDGSMHFTAFHPDWSLTADGSCGACGHSSPGVFDDEPGTWGARRFPVRMADYR